MRCSAGWDLKPTEKRCDVKPVGEPPLMQAFSVREAIRDAVANFGKPGGQVPLASPATGEAVWRAIEGRRSEG